MIILKEYLKELLINIKCQLKLANETVEYTSWLTASIFSVLSVFTIFLSHQYHNHTAELEKLIWKMRDNIKRKEPIEFEQNVVDFEYLSKTPNILKKAVRTSTIVLIILIPVWGVSGLSRLIYILDEDGTTHYLSLVLITIVTGLFIFFSIRLANILKQLSEPEEANKISTIKDLLNAKNLFEKNFDIPNLFALNNTKWNFLLSGSSPYSKVKIDNEYGMYNYSLILYIDTISCEMYISTPILLQENGTLPKELQLDLTEQERIDIQRFFFENTVNHMTITQAILLDGEYYFFKGEILKEGDLFTISMLGLGNSIDLPTDIKNEIENGNKIVYFNNLL